MSTVSLLVNYYIENEYKPSRSITFLVTEECLEDYLTATEDERTIEQFLDTYDSDESAVIYEYGSDDGRIISERITYCDDFEDRYKEFISHSHMISKEQYYWSVYDKGMNKT